MDGYFSLVALLYINHSSICHYFFIFSKVPSWGDIFSQLLFLKNPVAKKYFPNCEILSPFFRAYEDFCLYRFFNI